MCRILFGDNQQALPLATDLIPFARIAHESKEYQGHGWGMYWNSGESWLSYKSLTPIWEDDLEQFGSATRFIVHARSAFQDEGIEIENNMPFSDGETIFSFNGELRGVRLREEGRIGAEKIYNFIRRFSAKGLSEAARKAIGIIRERTKYIRGLNFILSSEESVVCYCSFSDDPEYYTLCFREGADLRICSEPYRGEEGEWRTFSNQEFREFSLTPKAIHMIEEAICS